MGFDNTGEFISVVLLPVAESRDRPQPLSYVDSCNRHSRTISAGR